MSPQLQWRIKDLTNGVLRAARELRNQSENLAIRSGEADVVEAWKKLDKAIRDRDDFIAGVSEEK